MSKTALVTGASSGIGAAAAELLAQNGWSVWGLSRRGSAPSGVRGVSGDITDPDSVRQVLSEIDSVSGRLDLLVNCAGSGISGAVEFTAEEDSRRQMAVNLDGTAAVCRASRQAENRVAEHIRVRGARPGENGLGSGGGILVRPDVSRMSRADRADIARRAARGEHVKLHL